MKISEMTNDQAADVMIRLADPIGSLCDDEEAVAMIDEYKKEMRKPVFYVVGRLIPRLVAYFMKNHKAEIYQIVSILSGEPVQTIGKKPFPETVKVIRESYDDVLAVFFPHSGNAISSAGTRLSAF